MGGNTIIQIVVKLDFAASYYRICFEILKNVCVRVHPRVVFFMSPQMEKCFIFADGKINYLRMKM